MSTNVIVNANGTIRSSFSIGKSGIVIYQGDGAPSEIIGKVGDIYIKHSVEPMLMQKTSQGWESVGGSASKSIVSISQTTTITPSDNETIYLIDTSSTDVTLTISTQSLSSGKTITFKDSSGTSGTNNITIQTEGSETIDGSSSTTVGASYVSLTMVSDGNNWFII